MPRLLHALGLALLFATSPSSSQEADLQNAELLRAQFLREEFLPVSKQKDLPVLLVNSFPGFGPGEIADSDKPYNHSDYLNGELPSRQIVIAGAAKNIVFIVLNQGGIAAHRYTIVVGEISDVIWLCSYYFPEAPLENVEELRALFEKGAYSSEPRCQDAA